MLSIVAGVERLIHAFLANSILVVASTRLCGNLNVQTVYGYGKNPSNLVGVCGVHTPIGSHDVAHNVKHH